MYFMFRCGFYPQDSLLCRCKYYKIQTNPRSERFLLVPSIFESDTQPVSATWTQMFDHINFIEFILFNVGCVCKFSSNNIFVLDR